MDFKLKSKIIEFKDSDGQVIGTLTVTQPRLMDDQVRAEMEEAAVVVNATENQEVKELTDLQINRRVFRNLYPKLAACSCGDVPDEETAFNMPAEEMYKWYDAAHSVAPEWFKVFDEIAEAYQKSKAAGDEAGKKKDKNRSRSRKSLKNF